MKALLHCRITMCMIKLSRPTAWIQAINIPMCNHRGQKEIMQHNYTWNLGAYIAKKTGRPMKLWPGTCIVHETFNERKLVELQVRHPGSRVIAHPECEPTLLQRADFIGSTSALLDYVVKSPATTFIVATEPGILHQMAKAAPDKVLIPLPGVDENCACNECPHMKRNTLEKMYLALRDLKPELTMSEELRVAALKPLEAMLALG